MDTIPQEQLTAFLQEAKNTGVYEMYYIDLATGLRRGEICGLKWEDIDLERGLLRVRRQVARINGTVQEVSLKTKNSYRTIPLSADTITVLKQQNAKTNDEYVFPFPNGGPISPDSVRNMLKRVPERAGLPDVRYHDLRHFAVSTMLHHGVDKQTVADLVGHADTSFLERTYCHPQLALKQQAATILSSALFDGVGEASM